MIDRHPRMTIVWTVLASAKDVGEHGVIAACRRLIIAHRRGWSKHAHKHDIALVWSTYDNIMEG